ncbi:MAG: hypothetical protein ACRCUY_10210 [Thermoguttaceae bacterium]
MNLEFSQNSLASVSANLRCRLIGENIVDKNIVSAQKKLSEV